MKRFFKVLGYIALTLVSLLIVGAVWLFAGDSIKDTWTKWTFEVPTSIKGVSLGDKKSDVIFKFGEGWIPEDGKLDEFLIYPKEDSNWTAWLDDEDRVYILDAFRVDGIPSEVRLTVPTTEDLIDTLGEPDILAISGDFTTRRYTYLEYGASFTYKQNSIVSFMIGEVSWRYFRGYAARGSSEYYINGVQICPGDGCPYDDEGWLKPEWEGKTYRDIPLDQ